MVAATTQIRIRVPARRMKNVRRMLGTMGVDAPGVVNMLFAQIELQGRLPFAVLGEAQPNATTRAAIEELESGNGLSSDSWDEFIDTLSRDED